MNEAKTRVYPVAAKRKWIAQKLIAEHAKEGMKGCIRPISRVVAISSQAHCDRQGKQACHNISRHRDRMSTYTDMKGVRIIFQTLRRLLRRPRFPQCNIQLMRHAS